MSNPASPRPGSSSNPRAWVEAQSKAFKGWINAHLAARQMQIDDLTNGFSDGVAFIHLLEILEKKPLDGSKPVHKAPRHKFDSLSAIILCLGILKTRDRRGVDLRFDEEVIFSGTDQRVALALAWRIICTYGIDVSDTTQALDEGDSQTVVLASTPEKQLLAWCNRRLPEEFQVNNFTTNWQSGHTLVMLVNQALDRGDQVSKVDYEDMDPDELLEGIFEMAENQLAIPQLLDVEMVLDHPNKQAIMTYVSLIRTAIESAEKERSHLNDSMAKVKRAMDTLEDQLRARISALETELETSRSERARLKNQLDQEQAKNERDHADWQQQKMTLSRDVERLQSEKQDLEHARTLAGEETATTVASRDQTISSLRAQVEGARMQNEELRSRMESIRQAEIARAGATSSYDETLVNDLQAEVAQHRKEVEDVKRQSEERIAELTTYWEAQKAKYIVLYDEYKVKLSTSNSAGREYRDKCFQLEEEKTHLSDEMAAMNFHLQDQQDHLAVLERQIANQRSEMESKDAVFRLQLHELGTFIKDMKDREDERDNIASHDVERRIASQKAFRQEMANAQALIAASQGGLPPPSQGLPPVPESAERSVRNQFNAQPISAVEDDEKARDSGIRHPGLPGQGAGGYAELGDVHEDDVYGPGVAAAASVVAASSVAAASSVDDLKRDEENIDPLIVNKRAFDRRVEAIKTKFNNEKIVTTWHYLGADGNVHEVILRHNTHGKRSKRVVLVDSEEKYNEKSTDMEFFIRRNQDNLRIQIIDAEDNLQVYKLFINDLAFDEMRKEHFRQMAQKRRESGL